MFTGTHALTIDEKNRLSIPSGVRASMDPERDGVHFYLAPGEREHTLELFPEKYYPQFVEKLHESLTDSPEAADFELFFTAMSALLEVDKQGRVLLPQHQLTSAGIGRQVTLMGCRDRLVLANRDGSETFVQDMWRKYRETRQTVKRTAASAEANRSASSGPSVRP